MSQQDLADLLEVTRDRVANYENERSQPPEKLVAKLAKLVAVPYDWFWDEAATDLPLKNVSVASMVTRDQINLVPYWGTVPCGDWQAPDGDGDLVQISETFDPQGVVAVRVSGDSMAPRLMHGQLVVVRLNKTPREGVVTLARSRDGELTLKVLRYVHSEWQLHSINPQHGVVSAETWEILGYAIGIEEMNVAGIRP